jgi:hypothetical protein
LVKLSISVALNVLGVLEVLDQVSQVHFRASVNPGG